VFTICDGAFKDGPFNLIIVLFKEIICYILLCGIKVSVKKFLSKLELNNFLPLITKIFFVSQNSRSSLFRTTIESRLIFSHMVAHSDVDEILKRSIKIHSRAEDDSSIALVGSSNCM
jgi:hypothetical protein